MLKFTLLFSILCLNSVISVEYIPVLLWGTGYTKPLVNPPALKKVTSDSFRDLVINYAGHTDIVLLFAEENLSIEDFTWKNEAGASSFTQLDNLTTEMPLSSQFLPAVEEPVEALLQDHKWDKLPANADLPAALSAKKNSKFVLVHLNDAADSEDRPDMLHRHDLTISAAVNAAKQAYSRILVIYSGYHSSWMPVEESVRHVRSLLAVVAENGSSFVNADNKSYLYTSEPLTLVINGVETKLEKFDTATATQTENKRDLNMTITYSAGGKTFKVVLPFPEKPTGYWNLNEVYVSEGSSAEVVLTAKGINAPYRFSYHCSQDIVFKNKENSSLTFKNFQVEPLPPSAEGGLFSEACDCVWFFTVPILMGLLTTILLLFILMSGLCMITDIRTMDRFDDPKGKTITISATD